MGEDPPRANVLLGRVQLFHQIKTVREILWIDRLRRIRVLVHGTSSRLGLKPQADQSPPLQGGPPPSSPGRGECGGRRGRGDEGQRSEDADAPYTSSKHNRPLPSEDRPSSATRPSGPRQVIVTPHQQKPSRGLGTSGSGSTSTNIPSQRRRAQQARAPVRSPFVARFMASTLLFADPGGGDQGPLHGRLGELDLVAV